MPFHDFLSFNEWRLGIVSCDGHPILNGCGIREKRLLKVEVKSSVPGRKLAPSPHVPETSKGVLCVKGQYHLIVLS